MAEIAHGFALVLLVLSSFASPSMAQSMYPEGLSALSVATVDTIPVQVWGVRGIAAAGGRAWLLVSENGGLGAPSPGTRSSILRLDLGTTALDTLASEVDGYETGLAFDGEALWAGGSVVGGHAAVYRIDPRGGRLLSSLPAPGHHPGGLVADDGRLWQVDCDARQLIRIETEEGKVSRKFPSPGFYPTGLAFDGFHFWVADAATGRIYRVRSTTGKADAAISARDFLRPGEFISLAWSDGRLWVASSERPEILRMELLR